MAQQPSSSTLAPVTEEAFLADRQKFFSAFTGFTMGSVIFLVIVVALMGIFLT